MSKIPRIVALAVSLLAAPLTAQDGSPFATLLAEHWRWSLGNSPVLATTLGVRDHDRELGDLTLAAMDRRAREAADFLARFDQLDTTRLAPAERVTRALVRRELAETVEGNRFGQRTVLFTTYYGWATGFANLPDSHPFRERADYEAYVARLAAFPRYNRGAIETTRAAVAGGFAQPCAPLASYEGAISGVTTDPPERSRFLEPFARRPASIDEAAWTALRARALAAVRDSVYPAYAALLDYYRRDYAPRCRATASVASTPGGAAYYAARVRAETTTELTPEEVHQLGLREVARIGAAMDSVAARAGAPSRAAFVKRLREDPRYYAQTPDALMSAAAVLAKRIDGELPRYFGRLPRLPYTVRPIPAAQAPITTTAYYERGSLEGGRPGIYRVNTTKLDQRPLYELPALTSHEAVPGHHLQIALSQELDLPPVRRYGLSFAAFTEGWGLYAERLGIEMGLYDTPEKEMGRLSYEMWRATRLVVDPGIHAKGWTRDQAIAYMLEHTALSRANIEAEVNRYITWPGQATAYKVGELRIRELRERAERRLGARFTLRAFHDAVLEQGPVSLDVLEAQVERWIAAQEGGAATSTARPPAPRTPDGVMLAFARFSDIFGGRLVAAFESIPAARYGYRPTPVQQTVGYIAQHLEEANYGLCERLGAPRPARSARDSVADTVKARWPKDTLVARLRTSLAFCDTALERLPRVESAALASTLLAYETDLAEHYSQVATYMRLLGLVPPSAIPPRPRTAIALPASALSPYVGVYELGSGLELEVTLRDGALFGRSSAGGEPARLWPESATGFFLKEVDAQLTFTRDATGAVKGLVLHQFGRDRSARKIR